MNNKLKELCMFICPYCKKESVYNSNTVFTLLTNTKDEFDFCSIECLNYRIEELNNGASEFIQHVTKIKVNDNPLTFEVTIDQ